MGMYKCVALTNLEKLVWKTWRSLVTRHHSPQDKDLRKHDSFSRSFVVLVVKKLVLTSVELKNVIIRLRICRARFNCTCRTPFRPRFCGTLVHLILGDSDMLLAIYVWLNICQAFESFLLSFQVRFYSAIKLSMPSKPPWSLLIPCVNNLVLSKNLRKLATYLCLLIWLYHLGQKIQIYSSRVNSIR